MIDTDKYEGHTSDWKWIDINEQDDFYLHSEYGDIINHDTPDGKLAQDAPLLLAEVKRYRLQDYAINQAEAMKAQVGDDTWHYAMEVWLYPETHYWGAIDEIETIALIERYITTNRDAWIKHWGEPNDVVQRRYE